jgi:hypothetical protein
MGVGVDANMANGRPTVQIDLGELRQVTTLLFDHLEQQGHTVLELTEDYYWVMPDEQLYDPLHDPNPATFGLGQLTADWESCQNLLRPEREPIGSVFVWVAALLRWISSQTVG